VIGFVNFHLTPVTEFVDGFAGEFFVPPLARHAATGRKVFPVASWQIGKAKKQKNKK